MERSEDMKKLLAYLAKLNREELISVAASCASRMRLTHRGGRPRKVANPEPASASAEDCKMPWEC